MTRGTAVAVLPFGLTISAIDAWFSIQSIAGAIRANNFLGYLVAIIMGVALTAFAVFLPVLKNAFRSVPWGLLWFFLTVIDLGSSALGAIWYGTLHHPFKDSIQIHQIRYDPGNWLNSAIYLGFVALIAVICVAFGYAIAALSGFRRDTPGSN